MPFLPGLARQAAGTFTEDRKAFVHSWQKKQSMLPLKHRRRKNLVAQTVMSARSPPHSAPAMPSEYADMLKSDLIATKGTE
jgi:hypothetical protein